ncbi:flagellar brake protein [Iodobacter fluviatilis]|uniref:Cyclic di-GMP binding protein YcgR n=1 Tax=Iodobacter fluviatilis TaxID=537 RepID=A0A377Q9Q7_9NEIS|nr:flagellar brake protein [Iodobacter fluviatilis]TCU82428.1 PilZ domain-containing protein [Iodobacter fluviatilis]STQ91653.1 Cyclic di-GMP binding protein YcgR [Iodobacter fluviatilis]
MNFKTTLKSLMNEVDELESFRKADRREILSIFSMLQKHGDALNLFLNNGDELILSHLLEINQAENTCCLLNPQADIPVCEAIAIATPGGGSLVKFNCDLNPWRFKGQAAFRIAIPDSIIKLQRREHFRTKIPENQPFYCQFQTTGSKASRFVICDLSIGGLSCWVPADFAQELQIAQQHKIIIELGHTGSASTLVEVCSLRQFEEISAHHNVLLLGMHFIALDHPLEAKLQKLLSQLEMAQRTVR